MGYANGEQREEGVGLFVLIAALRDSNEVNAVPNYAILQCSGDTREQHLRIRIGRVGGGGEAGGVDGSGGVVRAEKRPPEQD